MSWRNLFERIQQLREHFTGRTRRAPHGFEREPTRLALEQLERRWLMSLAAITQYPLLSNTNGDYLISGPLGYMWTNDPAIGLIRISTTGASTYYSCGSEPTPPGGTQARDFVDLAAGPGGGVIAVTDPLVYSPIGGLSVLRPPTAGTLTSPGHTSGGNAGGGSGFGGGVGTPMAGGPYELGFIGFVDPTTGATTYYSLGKNNRPGMICAGPDGAFWFTDSQGVGTVTGYIGRITTGGAVTYYSLGTGVGANGIIAGADGNIWFTLSTNYVGRITTGGTITLFPAYSGGAAMAVAPDGNIWFSVNSSIARISPTGVYFPGWSLATVGTPVGATQMQFGPDGLLWFGNGFDSFGSLDTADGNVNFYRVDGVIQNGIGNGAGPGLTVGPDNRIWMIAGDQQQAIFALNYSQLAWPVLSDPIYGMGQPVPGGPGSGGLAGGGPAGASNLPAPGTPGAGGPEPFVPQDNFTPSINTQTSGSAFSVATGNLKVQAPVDIGLSDPGCGCGSPFSLTYNSDSISFYPVIEFTVFPQLADGLPQYMQAQLFWNNQPISPNPPVYSYNLSGITAGEAIVGAIQSNIPVTQTGVYHWQVQVTVGYSGGILSTYSLGIMPVVINAAPFGAGWSVSGVNSLLPIPAGGSVPQGVQYIYGSGGSRFFTLNSDGSFNAPLVDHGALVSSTTGGVTTYTYTTPQLTTYTYTSSGKIVSEVTAQQLRTTFGYNGSGLLSNISVPDGGVGTFNYDANNFLSTIQEPAGRTMYLTHPAPSGGTSPLLGITLPDTSNRTFGYDGNYHLTSDVWGPLSAGYAYNSSFSSLATITLSGGQTIHVQPSFVTLLTGPTALPNVPTSVVTEANSHATTVVVDPLAALKQVQTADTGTTTYTRDKYENPVGITDPRGYTTGYGFDQWADVTQVSHPDGSGEQYQYDPRFKYQTVHVDGNGHRTTTAYDGYAEPTTVTDALGRTTTYTYSPGGNLGGLAQTATDPNGNVTSYAYDSHRRLTQEVDGYGSPVATTTTMVYDGFGNLLSQTTGQSTTATYAHPTTTSYAYDALRRKTVEIDGYGSLTTTPAVTSYQYDGAGDRTQMIDPRGTTTVYYYDSTGRQTAETDAYGSQTTTPATTTTAYDSDGNVLSTIDPDGHVTSYAYDRVNRRTEVIGAWNSQAPSISSTAYDLDGNVTQAIDADGNVNAFAYDPMNRVIQEQDGVGKPELTTATMVYDLAGNQVSETRGQSSNPAYAHPSTTNYSYDALNRVTSQTNAYGLPEASTTTMAYDPAGNLTLQTSGYSTYTAYSHPSTSTYVYDALNRQISESDAIGTTAVRTSATAYDAAGNVIQRTDPSGHVTSYSYDSLNRQTLETAAYGLPEASSTTTGYDPAGNVTQTIDPDGHSTTFAYDALNRQTAETEAAGTTAATSTTMAYDAAGNLTLETTGYSPNPAYSNPDTVTYAYDALNRRTSETDAVGTTVARTTRTAYDLAGNVVQSYDALGNATSFTYDALNRQVAEQTPAGGYVVTNFDAAGNVVAQTDQLGYATTYTYDGLNRKVTSEDADLNVTTYAYDAAGNLTTLTDADRNVTTMAYDALGRETAMTDPLGHTATMAYDAVGNRTATTDRDGRLTTYAYDGLNREIGSTWTVNGTVTNVQAFAYDQAGNQLTAADYNGAYTMAYDALNRETSVQELFGQALTYAYDAAGNRTSVQDSQGGTTTSVYDALGRLTTREFGGPGQTTLREDLTYNADDQILTETRYDDLNQQTLAGTSSYVYDTDQRLTSLTQTYANGTVLASYTYGYDSVSRLTAEVDNGGAPITYIYDGADQLLQAGAATYGYDPTGNRTNTGYQTGPDNQLLSDGTSSYTYDAEGNRLTKTAGNDVTTYSYDNENRLVGVIETVGGTLHTQATYVYDVVGNRIQTQEYTASGGAVTTEYSYDGVNAWANFSGTGILQMRQLFLPGEDQMLARVSGGGAAAWYLTDRQGSVRNIQGYDGTMVLDTIAYDAYGKITNETNSAQGDAYKYDGYMYDAPIALYYVRARYYDATTGRWISQDPVGLSAADPNLARYVRNDPVNNTDPTGLINFWIQGSTVTMWVTVHFKFVNRFRPTTTWQGRELAFMDRFKNETEKEWNSAGAAIFPIGPVTLPGYAWKLDRNNSLIKTACLFIPKLKISTHMFGSPESFDYRVEVESNPPPRLAHPTPS